MKCLTAQEFTALELPHLRFSAPQSNKYRNSLPIKDVPMHEQAFVVGSAFDTYSAFHFACRLNAWLSDDGLRILWVEDWDNNYLGPAYAFEAVRREAGEVRTIAATPAHVFEEMNYAGFDDDLSEAERTEMSRLTTLILLMLLSGWDGWLMSSTSAERVRVFEGKLSLCTGTKSRLAEGEALLREFGCMLV